MGAVSMALPVHMLAPSSRFPFTGSIRVRVSKGHNWLFASGYIARETGVKRAYVPARIVQSCIEKAAQESFLHHKRRAVLETVWNALFEMPRDQLGKNRGSDLALLIAAGDEEGVNLCAIRISGLWGKIDGGDSWMPILPKNHPIFDIDGLGEEFPGSLHIAYPPKVAIATAQPLFPILPGEAELRNRLGATEL